MVVSFSFPGISPKSHPPALLCVSRRIRCECYYRPWTRRQPGGTMEFTRNTGFLPRWPLSKRRDEASTKDSSAREIWPLTTLWVLAAILSILYCVFIYKSLLSDNPQIGSLLPSASDTNLVVSIFSQVLGNMFEVLLMGAFDALRWQLASTYSGVSATTFFQLSSSTQWIPVLFLTLTKLSSGCIGIIRYYS